MNSLSSTAAEEKRRQDEIRRQIATLQAQLDPQAALPLQPPSSPKRKREAGSELVPATPSPKKRKFDRKIDPVLPTRSLGAPKIPATSRSSKPSTTSSASGSFLLKARKDDPKPSNFLKNLASASHKPDPSLEAGPSRTTDFSDKPVTKPPIPPPDAQHGAKRDENMVVVQDFESGPVEVTAPPDDPLFEKLEPNSGIRLASRQLSNDEFSDHLFGRYFLSPAQLYSCIRLLSNKQGYEVPVPGDFVTIAVVAERGPIRVSKAPAAPVEPHDDEDSKQKKTDKSEERANKPSGKKYVNFKLVDFANREKSSMTGGKAVIRGDALLSLLLFEADGFDKMKDDNGRERKLYRGGSKGAFEKLSKVKEGDVIALLNPRILKPFTRSNDSPHPINNMLSVTPESAESIIVIGRSQDLGHCGVIKKDGKRCGSWCDKRISGDVCEWHIQAAVQQKRSSRPEFAAGTSGMGNSARNTKPDYDPSRKWGLKPEGASSGPTYVVSGHVISGNARNIASADSFRDSQASKKARKSLAEKDKEIMESLLKHDKRGMKAVVRAREHIVREREKEQAEAACSGKSKGKGRASTTLKGLGFGALEKEQRETESRAEDLAKTMAELKNAAETRSAIHLGAARGVPKIRSGVVVPPQQPPPQETGMVNLDSDED